MVTAALRLGERSEAVRDLQRRLAARGFDVRRDEPGAFGAATDAALRRFQEERGLRVDGVCGRETWSALVEAGLALGDRMLYLRRPMLRGDDVRALQRRLNGLGFDAGREDGIFGDETAVAVVEFQRNAGLAVDGISGDATVEALSRLGTLADGSVAAVREREALRRGPRTLRERRIFVAVTPGLDALGASVTHELSARGADALLDAGGADDSALAAEANRFGAQLCLAVRSGTERGVQLTYFGNAGFRSETGHRLAGTIQEEISSTVGRVTCAARAYALLRETRMPAVLCELDPTPGGLAPVVAQAGRLGAAIAEGVRRGVEEPLPEA